MLHPSCTPTINKIDLSPPDIEQVVHFFESLEITPKLVDDAARTEIQVIKDITAYNRGVDSEDIHMYITDLIEKYGYKAEEHVVETFDGYILTMQRIPSDGPVVFLMHGLFSSADDFVTAGPASALAYYLASRGFDVWLGNARGNKHSRKHVTISPDCAEFWDFSWDEVGRYDLPAMIDYALDTTGQSKLASVAHSLGNTAFFVMCSEVPQYNDKISVIIALSPVAWMSHMKSPPFRFLAIDNDMEYSFAKAIGLDEVVPDTLLIRTLMGIVCGDSALSELICSNIFYFVLGFDLGQWNITNIPVIWGHNPAGASTKQVIHYTQEIESGRFCQFDYGDSEKNTEEYQSDSPPDYDVTKVTAPVALFCSDVDWISNLTDVEILRNKLPNVVKYYFVDHYFHFDYLWAKNMNEKTNPVILDLVQTYN